MTHKQLSDAQTIWEKLPDWQHYDQVLAFAKDQFPDNTHFEPVLLKVALLDRLYRTNVYDLIQAANRVVQIFGTMPDLSGIDKVVQLSDVTSNGERHLTSFASKYVHIFHDDSVPIYDSYAAFALTCHWGYPQSQIDKWREDYSGYCQSIDDLKRRSCVSAQARQMDRYLWLAGNWLWLQKRREKAGINKELRAFFEDSANRHFAEATFGGLLK